MPFVCRSKVAAERKSAGCYTAAAATWLYFLLFHLAQIRFIIFVPIFYPMDGFCFSFQVIFIQELLEMNAASDGNAWLLLPHRYYKIYPF